MADYYRPTPGNPNQKKDGHVADLVREYGGPIGEEGALLNGLIAMGYDPALVRSLADADPDRRYLDDAVVRALRAGVLESDIKDALKATRLAAEGKPAEAIKALGRTRDQLPPEAQAAFDAIANRQPLPFLDRGQRTPPSAAPPSPTTPGAPAAAPIPTKAYEEFRAGERAAVNKPAPGAPTIMGRTPAPGTGATPGAGPGAGTTPPPKPLTPDQIKADIQRTYGWGAALMDIPEVAAILNRVGSGPGQISADEANRLFMASDYYRSTTETQRKWKVLQGTNPGDAAQQLQGQVDSIKAKAQVQGVTVPEDRIRQLAEVSKANGWSDQQINAALASEIHWDPTGAKVGTLASIKSAQQNQLVPMSDTAMTQWAQAIVSGDKTLDDFNAYLKDQARSLFPTMATYLDTTPGGTVRQYLNPYSETIGKTLGMNPASIDWLDPKWFRFVNSQDAKTGERKMVDIADVQRTLIADPQYNYDQTVNGKAQKAGLARTILQDWGFMAGNQGGLQ